MRSAQVLPVPPERCDEKKSHLPSGEKRGLLLSVAGAV